MATSNRPKIDDGGQAFPCQDAVSADGTTMADGWAGMSMREYFAGQAAIGLLANPEALRIFVGLAGLSSGRTAAQALQQPEIMETISGDVAERMARACYRYADAMVAARLEGGAA